MTCRICLEEGDLIQPCHCTGTTAHVHEECLLKWLAVSNRTNCEICHYEYEFVEVDEEVTVYCPRWTFATTTDATAAVIFIGLIGHFIIMFFTSYWGTTTEDMFFYGNLIQLIMLALIYPNIRPRETFVFWKCCSSMSLLFASVVQHEWKFFSFEIIITFIFALHTYAHLAIEHKQRVRYINIENRSVNDEAVQRP